MDLGGRLNPAWKKENDNAAAFERQREREREARARRGTEQYAPRAVDECRAQAVRQQLAQMGFAGADADAALLRACDYDVARVVDRLVEGGAASACTPSASPPRAPRRTRSPQEGAAHGRKGGDFVDLTRDSSDEAAADRADEAAADHDAPDSPSRRPEKRSKTQVAGVAFGASSRPARDADSASRPHGAAADGKVIPSVADIGFFHGMGFGPVEWGGGWGGGGRGGWGGGGGGGDRGGGGVAGGQRLAAAGGEMTFSTQHLANVLSAGFPTKTAMAELVQKVVTELSSSWIGGSLSNSTPFSKLQRVNERLDHCLSVSVGYVPTLTGTEPCPTYTNKQIAEMIAECRGCWAGTMKTGVEPYQVTDAEGLLYWLTVSDVPRAALRMQVLLT
jgi:hypothetical protein